MAKFLSDTKVAWDISPMAIFFRTIIVCFGTFCMFSWATYLCVFGLPVTIFLGNMFVWFWIFCRFLGNMFVYFLDILPVLFWGQYVFVCWNILSVVMLFWATCSCVFYISPLAMFLGQYVMCFGTFCLWQWSFANVFVCFEIFECGNVFRQHVCVFCLWQCFLGNMFVCFACGNVF